MLTLGLKKCKKWGNTVISFVYIKKNLGFFGML